MRMGTLKEAARWLDKPYDTVRRYASIHENFPKPLSRNAAGHGILWDVDEIDAWWKQYETNMPDRSTRAKIGHQNRLTRQMEGHW